MLEGILDAPWGRLRHAYGKASDTPDLIGYERGSKMTGKNLFPTLGRLCLVAALGGMAGCTVEKVEGNVTTFTFAPWVPALVFLGGVGAIPAGWLLRRWSPRWGWTLLILGPVGLVIVAPGLLLDHVTVDDRHFSLRTGFWFAPTVHEVHFSNLTRIEIVGETQTTRGGQRTNYYLLCYRKSGGADKVPIGDLMKQGAVIRVLESAKAQGIPIADRS
jgi:hypothetical protein